jgi:hypothetical protein
MADEHQAELDFDPQSHTKHESDYASTKVGAAI